MFDDEVTVCVELTSPRDHHERPDDPVHPGDDILGQCADIPERLRGLQIRQRFSQQGGPAPALAPAPALTPALRLTLPSDGMCYPSPRCAPAPSPSRAPPRT